MDGTTEPIIAVIGHPIAGNPSQFAVERALREMKLDWRVLSFDVDPEDVAAAIEGFSVIGVAGVLIDPSVTSSASRWYTQKASEADDSPIDCLYRDDQKFVASYERRGWVDDLITEHAGEQRILLGDFLDDLPLCRDGFSEDSISLPPDPDLIEDADVIVISQGSDEAVSLDTEDWPKSDGSTLVIDLTAGHPDQALIRQLGYRVAGELEQQTGTLQRCLERWTGINPSGEVIHDAIEEYFGV
jgi:hypothetical protein